MKINNVTSKLLIVGCIVALLALVSSVLFMWETNYGGVPTPVVGVILSLVLAYALYVLMAKKRLSWIFLITTIAICAAALMGLIIFLLAYLSDISGKACTGFFGSQTSCVDNAQLTILILLYNPFVVVSILVVSTTSLVIQATRKDEKN